MTTPDSENDPEPPAVRAVLGEAQREVQRVSTFLQSRGWDAIIISLTRAIEVAPGDWRAPGATATLIDRTRCGPVAAQLADVMRKQADMLDEQQVGEYSSGYIQDQTDHASGGSRWPGSDGGQ